MKIIRRDLFLMGRPKILEEMYNDFCKNVSDEEFILYMQEHIGWIAAKHFGVKESIIKRRFKELSSKIEVDYKKRKENTIIYKYGSVESFNESVREKREQTMIDNFGSIESAKEYASRRQKECCLERYGVENVMFCAEFREKQKVSVNNYLSIEENREHVQQKIRETKIKKYGSLENAEKERVAKLLRTLEEHPEINEMRVKKIADTLQERYGDGVTSQFKRKDMIEESLIKKYGSIEEANKVKIDGMKRTCIERYGVDNYGKTKEHSDYIKENHSMWQDKVFSTFRKNGTFNSSKAEDSFYQSLLPYFDSDDIVRQYRDEKRYPFNCDFYIKSLDLFIELNLHWTHGGKPFDPNDEECQNKLALWQEKAKTSNFYKNAIKVWTVSDNQKLLTATKGGLNYIAVYSMPNDFASNLRLHSKPSQTIVIVSKRRVCEDIHIIELD